MKSANQVTQDKIKVQHFRSTLLLRDVCRGPRKGVAVFLFIFSDTVLEDSHGSRSKTVRNTIVLVGEGDEGAGKTTATKKLVERLTEDGVPAIWTREPGGCPDAESIRALIFQLMESAGPETMFGMFWAARAAHIKDTIVPAIDAGRIVGSDRLDGYTFACQLDAQGQKQLLPLFWAMREHYLAGIIDALRYVYFDIEPSVGLQRVNSRTGAATDYDLRGLEFHNKIQEGYQIFWSTIGEPWVRIDANLPPEEVLAQLYSHTLHWIGSNGAPL